MATREGIHQQHRHTSIPPHLLLKPLYTPELDHEIKGEGQKTATTEF
jgi:hypothetical protein